VCAAVLAHISAAAAGATAANTAAAANGTAAGSSGVGSGTAGSGSAADAADGAEQIFTLSYTLTSTSVYAFVEYCSCKHCASCSVHCLITTHQLSVRGVLQRTTVRIACSTHRTSYCLLVPLYIALT
jgi:hypothetical protein